MDDVGEIYALCKVTFQINALLTFCIVPIPWSGARWIGMVLAVRPQQGE